MDEMQTLRRQRALFSIRSAKACVHVDVMNLVWSVVGWVRLRIFVLRVAESGVDF